MMVVSALLSMHLGVSMAQPVGDSDRLEQMWQDTHRIMPGTYHLDRQISFDINGIRVLHLDGVVFDGSALPVTVPWLTQFCSAQRLQNIIGGSWNHPNQRIAVQVNRNACTSVASRIGRAEKH
jgi:hypothetical protein